MSFFRFAYRQSEKGLGRTFLFALLLSFIFSLSVLVLLLKGVSTINSDDELNQFNSDMGCEIINYELTCDQDYYQDEEFIIDLDYDEDLRRDALILSKDKVITPDGSVTYKQIFEIIGHDDSTFTIDDLKDFIGPMLTVMVIVVFVVIFIVMFIWYLVSNILLALVMKLLVNSIMNKNFSFESMYKMTMVTVLPYVLFNAITRMIFDGVLTGYITSFIPFTGGLLRLILDYAIIFGLTYLAVKEGENTESV